MRGEREMALKNDRYAYRVIWSADDQEYVGLCVEFPSLSWLAATPEAALKGIRKVVAESVERQRRAVEEWITERAQEDPVRVSRILNDLVHMSNIVHDSPPLDFLSMAESVDSLHEQGVEGGTARFTREIELGVQQNAFARFGYLDENG